MSRLWRQWRNLIIRKVLHADDSPHEIAMGASVAMFVAMLPLIGIQTIIAVGIAAAIRVNKAICVPIVWITNPITMGPIYGGCWAVGSFLTGSGQSHAYHRFLAEVSQHKGFGKIFDPAFWSDLFNFLINVGVDLWLGCAVVGIVLAIVTYGLARWGVAVYRARRRRLRRDHREFLLATKKRQVPKRDRALNPTHVSKKKAPKPVA